MSLRSALHRVNSGFPVPAWPRVSLIPSPPESTLELQKQPTHRDDIVNTQRNDELLWNMELIPVTLRDRRIAPQ